jgi:hypothetical protein
MDSNSNLVVIPPENDNESTENNLLVQKKNLSSYGLVKDDYRIVATKLSKVH